MVVVKVHLLSVCRDDGPLTAEELEELGQAIEEACERAGIDNEIVLFSGELEGIDRAELLEALRDNT